MISRDTSTSNESIVVFMALKNAQNDNKLSIALNTSSLY